MGIISLIGIMLAILALYGAVEKVAKQLEEINYNINKIDKTMKENNSCICGYIATVGKKDK